jgi:hypothetical protein
VLAKADRSLTAQDFEQDFEDEKPALQMVALGVALARRRTPPAPPNPLSLLNSLAYNPKNKPTY